MVDFLMMFSLCICVLSGVTLLIVHIGSKKKQKKEEAEEKTGGTVFHSGTKNVPKPIKERAGILQVLAPDGVNTMPVSYMTLDDNGIELYYAGLYIDKLPVEGRFAHSFAGIFNMDYVESTVIIDPLLEESQKKINRRIRSLDMERSGERDRNRLRILDGKIADAERWARQIDSDQSTLFETYFLFLIRAESLKLLTERISEFISRGKGIGFRHNYLDGQYIKDTTNLTQSQVDTVLNLGGTSEAKKYGELCLVDIPTKRAVFIQADYLKDSEFDVVETDVEKIAEHARMKQGA